MSPSVKLNFELYQDAHGYPPVAVESVWATPAEDVGQFVLDNVPFFVREATIGDTVKALERGSQHWFECVVKRSENSLIRVVFFEPTCVSKVTARLIALGCSVEFLRAHNLLAVSIPVGVALREIQECLAAEAATGSIDYEEPILRQD
jgi:hypothetical protein